MMGSWLAGWWPPASELRPPVFGNSKRDRVWCLPRCLYSGRALAGLLLLWLLPWQVVASDSEGWLLACLLGVWWWCGPRVLLVGACPAQHHVEALPGLHHEAEAAAVVLRQLGLEDHLDGPGEAVQLLLLAKEEAGAAAVGLQLGQGGELVLPAHVRGQRREDGGDAGDEEAAASTQASRQAAQDDASGRQGGRGSAAAPSLTHSRFWSSGRQAAEDCSGSEGPGCRPSRCWKPKTSGSSTGTTA